MKQKIVIKVDDMINCFKCRTKALKIAAEQDGVTSVALEGPEKDKVVVVGEGVDAATLALCLGKKLHHASILSVEEVKPKPPAPKKEEPKKEEPPKCWICKSICCATPNCCLYSCPPMPMYTVVPCDNGGPNCIIM